ncbi:lactosylceramide 4-alpha-galactosyltransferase-like [Olea europaea var. sylvestris]|uniref:lactosylceramide 4-alpha-galactosyltransferase-like n=1 Tax=Olea europaea var. sylvestris TaxID=158386 RepID=UPI000C1D3602|nr:lactosylceramide 4-alpha-galactosyltransferase-like [Olea europaea var. sylvestris]
MFDSLRFSPIKVNIFSIITSALIIFVIISANSLFSNSLSIYSVADENRSNHRELRTHKISQLLKSTSSDDQVRIKLTDKVTEEKGRIPELKLFESTNLMPKFDSRVGKFFSRYECKAQFFMTWISPAESFGSREFFVIESLFKTNPIGCLIILSKTMDSRYGYRILKPLIKRGYGVEAITPNLYSLFNNTPSEKWFDDIKNGKRDTGEIPLAQNLSNLIRLAVLYKFGGIYLDTDFIVLKDFSGLRNSIGAQSIDLNGNWTRLNNAVLAFDKKHPLLYMFMEEFALTFDGNRWGHNGPYLVSRVVDRVEKEKDFNFTVLPPMAFYPVDWIRVARFFARPNDQNGEKWIKAKLRQLKREAYGVHLWNRQSSRFNIEEGSIIDRLISDRCIVCRYTYNS